MVSVMFDGLGNVTGTVIILVGDERAVMCKMCFLLSVIISR